jgi:hypothetical protein
MILLNANIPPNVFYAFRHYLNILRLSSDKAAMDYDLKNELDYSIDKGLFNIQLNAANYRHLISHNIPLFYGFGITLICFAGLIRFLHYLIKRGSVKRQVSTTEIT